jgi:hypothetical protein
MDMPYLDVFYPNSYFNFNFNNDFLKNILKLKLICDLINYYEIIT